MSPFAEVTSVDRQASRARAYRFIIERAGRVTLEMLPSNSQISLSDLGDPSHQLIAVLRTLPGSVVAPGEIDEHLVIPFASPGP